MVEQLEQYKGPCYRLSETAGKVGEFGGWESLAESMGRASGSLLGRQCPQ